MSVFKREDQFRDSKRARADLPGLPAGDSLGGTRRGGGEKEPKRAITTRFPTTGDTREDPRTVAAAQVDQVGKLRRAWWEARAYFQRHRRGERAKPRSGPKSSSSKGSAPRRPRSAIDRYSRRNITPA